MEKLRDILVSMGIVNDKLQHLVVGFAIGLVFGTLFFFIHSMAWAALAALASSTGAGAAKELIYDKLMGRGTFGIEDIASTGLGGAIAMLLIGMIDYLV